MSNTNYQPLPTAGLMQGQPMPMQGQPGAQVTGGYVAPVPDQNYQNQVYVPMPQQAVIYQEQDNTCLQIGCVCGACIPLVGCICACANWEAPEGTRRKSLAKQSLYVALLFAIIWGVVYLTTGY